MAVSIKTNTYKRPFNFFALTNGIIGYTKNYLKVILGATQTLSVASVPADLSTLILNAPNGRAYTFQFVYNASVQTLGIKVPLPAGGASTAAQVNTALQAVLNSGQALDITSGLLTTLPFSATITAAAATEVDYNVPGAPGAISGTQATITNSISTAQSISSAPIVPARIGPVAALMPGA